jgi:hypothetical protein
MNLTPNFNKYYLEHNLFFKCNNLKKEFDKLNKIKKDNIFFNHLKPMDFLPFVLECYQFKSLDEIKINNNNLKGKF